MTSSSRKTFPAPGPRRLRWLAAAVAIIVPLAIPAGPADARVRAARAYAGAYDGIWNVVFATTRGTCSSGYSVPFTVIGNRVTSAGGGRGRRRAGPRGAGRG